MKTNLTLDLVVLALVTAACSSAPRESAATPADSSTFAVVNREEFARLLPGDASVEKIAGDQMFVEGPVWIDKDGGYLVYSDIPADQLKRWDPAGGVQVFRSPSGMANGNTLDREGRLVTAEHSGRISRTEQDGRVVLLVDRYDGKRLSSPNDVVIKSDGTIWFTDPEYGLGDRQKETPGNYVYRFDEAAKRLTAVVTDAQRPNGLCFSPDERTLYVADSGEVHHIRAFDVNADGTLANGRIFAVIDPGAPDGIRCDQDGRVWTSAGDGVQILSPSGDMIARILLPEAAANLAWGGGDGMTLYMTARTSIYAVKTSVTGAKRP
jgi:gluconolactonase